MKAIHIFAVLIPAILICLLIMPDVSFADPGDNYDLAENDPFTRPLPEKQSDYRFILRGDIIPGQVDFVIFNGLSYWVEKDSNGYYVAQLVNIGVVTEGQVVTVPEYIPYEDGQCQVVSVGKCFQPFNLRNYPNGSYMYHVGISANPVDAPDGWDESGYKHFTEPVHYSIVFKGCVKVQDFAFSEFDLFNGGINAAYCFYTKSGITSITFEKGVSSIGAWAFAYSCIENVYVPESTVSVGYGAFFRTYNLDSAVWDSDADISDYCFMESTLSEIMICGNPKNIGEHAFSSTKITCVDIPDSVTTIGDHTFHFCGELASVSIGKGITDIPAACFHSCGKLTDVSITGTIREVGPTAFYMGPSLNSFDFSKVERIGYSAFSGTFTGNDVVMLDLSNTKRIEDGAFNGCTAPVVLILSPELEYVGTAALAISSEITGGDISLPAHSILAEGAFYGSNITSVSLGDECTVGKKAFNECTFLESVSFGENCILEAAVDSNGPVGIFAGSGLRSVTIPKTLEIGRAAFSRCDSLETVVFENGRAEIGQEWFRNCGNLTNVTFPDSLKFIGVNAFNGCTRLDISGTVFGCSTDDVLSWSYDAFRGTASIVEYRLFEGDLEGTVSFLNLKLIIDGTPQSCSFMVDIVGANNSMQLEEPYAYRYVMPDDIVGIYDYAMGKQWPACVFPNGLYRTADDGGMYDSSGFTLIKVPYNQTNLNIPDNVTEIAPQACRSAWLTLVHIPSSVIIIGDEAFSYCNSLSVVEFEEGVEYIGDRAFSYTSLTEVSLPSSVRYVGDAAFKTIQGSVVNIPCDSKLVHAGHFAFKVIEGGSVFIPAGLTETGDLPFYYSMSEIYLGGVPSLYTTDFLRSTTQEVFVNGQWIMAHPIGVTFYLPLGTDVSRISFDQLLGCEDGCFGGYYVPTPSGPLLVDDLVDTSLGAVYLYTPLGQISDSDWIADGEGAILSLTVDGYWTQYDVVCSIDRGSAILLDSESPYILRIRVEGDVDGAVLIIAERVVSEIFTVTFDSRGGSECAPIVLGTGRTIPLNDYPSSVRNRSEFLGWADGNGVMFEPFSPICADITLYAVWADANPRLVFNENAHMIVRVNGTAVESGYRVSQDDEICLEWTSKEGYTFNNWALTTPYDYTDVYDEIYLFRGVTDDLTISVSEGYYNPSDSLRYINSVEFPIDYEAFYLQWMTSFIQDTSGSMWTGGAGTPLVVNDRMYVRAGGILYMYDLDTGRMLKTVESYDSGGYYSYIGYANGLVFDFKTKMVYNLDLDYVCDFPGGSRVLWDDTGIYLGGSGTIWKYSPDMKEMIWSRKGCTTYNSWGVTGGMQLYGGYLYWIGVRDSTVILQSVDVKTGLDFHEIALTYFKDYLLDDGWITCCNNTLYFTVYSTGLFGESSGATGGGVVAVAFEDGAFIPEYRYYDLGDKAHSNFIVYNGRGYVNSGRDMFVFDVDDEDGRILNEAYSYHHGRYTHGGITLNVIPRSNMAEVIFIPYDATTSIMVFYDTPGQMLPKYRSIYTQVPSQYNTQCVRFTDDGRIYFYNDAGNVCVLGDRIEDPYLMIRENDKIRCIVYDGTVEEAISEYNLSDLNMYMFSDFPSTSQLQYDESLTQTYMRYFFSDVPMVRPIYADDQQWYSDMYGVMDLETIKSGRLYLSGGEFILIDRDAYDYSIRYVDMSGNQIENTVTGTAPAGTELDLREMIGKNIGGYIYRNASSDRLVVSPDETRNVIVLTYDVVRTVTVDLTDVVHEGKAVIENLQTLAIEGNPVEFVLLQGKIELDTNILNNLGQSAIIGLRTVDLNELVESQRKNVPEGAAVFSITVESMGAQMHELGGTARITLQVSLTSNNLSLWHLDDSGAMHRIEDVVFTDSEVSFTTNHLSYYVVSENQGSDDGGFPTLYVAIMAVVVVVVLSVTLFLHRRQNA